jgi:anti-anti-sigma factor
MVLGSWTGRARFLSVTGLLALSFLVLHCAVCGSHLKVEPSDPAGDSPCPNCGHLLWFPSENPGAFRVITPTGDIFELSELEWLDRAFAPVGERIVLDLSEVRSLSSAELGKLTKLRRRLEASRGKLRLRNVLPDLREVFRISRLDEVFEIKA